MHFIHFFWWRIEGEGKGCIFFSRAHTLELQTWAWIWTRHANQHVIYVNCWNFLLNLKFIENAFCTRLGFGSVWPLWLNQFFFSYSDLVRYRKKINNLWSILNGMYCKIIFDKNAELEFWFLLILFLLFTFLVQMNSSTRNLACGRPCM